MALSLQQAADIVEIGQLKSAYAWHFDTPDLDALVDLFTDDAVCDFGPYGMWKGKQEIRDGFQDNIKAPTEIVRYAHNVTNPLIDVDGDEAQGRWYLLDHVITDHDRSQPLRAVAIYQEKYKRVAGDWKIAFSRIDFLWSADTGRVKGDMENKLNHD